MNAEAVAGCAVETCGHLVAVTLKCIARGWPLAACGAAGASVLSGFFLWWLGLERYGVVRTGEALSPAWGDLDT